jgi:small nuclear ribonucleoprotein (snRNP)-like protein
MLPLSLLRTAQNHPMLVELKNGETYNGHLVSCDNWMNINLREVTVIVIVKENVYVIPVLIRCLEY